MAVEINQELIDSLTHMANTAKGNKPSLDVNTKVSVEGKEYSLLELVGAIKQVQTLTQERDSLKSKRDKFVSLLDRNLSPAQRKEALIEWFKEGGYSHVDAEAMAEAELGNATKPVEDEVDEGDEDEGDLEDDVDPNASQTLKALKELQDKIARMEQSQQQGLQKDTNERLMKAIESSLGKNDKFSKVFGRVGRIKTDNEEERKATEEAITTFRKTVSEGVKRRAVDALREQWRNTGRLEPEWIDAAVEKATQEEAETQKAVIGIMSSVGKTPETVPTELRQFLDKEPMAAPSLDDIAKMSVGEANKAVEKFIYEGLASVEARQLSAASEGI